MTAHRNKVSTYLGKRTFYAKDMAKKHRASQDTDLPPRCVHCRRSWGVVMVGEVPHCEEHFTMCDESCGRHTTTQ